MKKIVFILSMIVIFIFIVLVFLLFNIDKRKNNSTNNNEFININTLEKDKNKYSVVSYYKNDNFDRYVNYEKNNPSLSIEDIVTRVNLNLDKKTYQDVKEANKLDTFYPLVNKFNCLTSNYIPSSLELLDNRYAKSGIYLVREAKKNLENLINDASNIGLNIRVVSAYRSYTYQEKLYNNYVKKDGVSKADTYSARAGFSEHQTGLVVDVTRAYDNFNNFENTKEYEWMINNSYKYGFILRYPKDKENITNYQFESWHYRFVGVDLASKIKDSNLTFDEYYIRFLDDKEK